MNGQGQNAEVPGATGTRHLTPRRPPASSQEVGSLTHDDTGG